MLHTDRHNVANNTREVWEEGKIDHRYEEISFTKDSNLER
jgi:hypothetical protein